MNTRPLIIAHANCYDGFTAAWVADRALRANFPGCDPEIVFQHYGDTPPDGTGRSVYIVDFSYPRATLERLATQARALTVLDHHRTAQVELADLPYAVFDQNECGASLTWRRLFGDLPMPPFVRYIKDYDLWRFELPRSHAVHAWIRSFDFAFATWDDLNDLLLTETGTRQAIEQGAAILRAEQRAVERMLQNATEVYLRSADRGHYPLGALFRVVNAADQIDAVGQALAQETGAGACWYMLADGSVKWSLRSLQDGPDVSEVAKMYPRGGGHAHSAGFRVSYKEHLRILGLPE